VLWERGLGEVGNDDAADSVGVRETAVEGEGHKMSVEDGWVKVEVEGDVQPGCEERQEAGEGRESR